MSVVQNPTCVTCSSATLIDHVYTNDIQSNYKCSILLHDTSDHFPLLFTVSCVTQKQENSYHMFRNMSQFVANEFINDLNDEYLKSSTLSSLMSCRKLLLMNSLTFLKQLLINMLHYKKLLEGLKDCRKNLC